MVAAEARVIAQARASSGVAEIAAALFKVSVAEAAPHAAPASAAAPAGEALAVVADPAAVLAEVEMVVPAVGDDNAGASCHSMRPTRLFDGGRNETSKDGQRKIDPVVSWGRNSRFVFNDVRRYGDIFRRGRAAENFSIC